MYTSGEETEEEKWPASGADVSVHSFEMKRANPTDRFSIVLLFVFSVQRRIRSGRGERACLSAMYQCRAQTPSSHSARLRAFTYVQYSLLYTYLPACIYTKAATHIKKKEKERNQPSWYNVDLSPRPPPSCAGQPVFFLLDQKCPFPSSSPLLSPTLRLLFASGLPFNACRIKDSSSNLVSPTFFSIVFILCINLYSVREGKLVLFSCFFIF